MLTLVMLTVTDRLIFNTILTQTQETNSLIHQILDIQPRMASSSGGKTNDEIVDELAENILGKIPDKLDIDKALPEMFEVDIVSRHFSLNDE